MSKRNKSKLEVVDNVEQINVDNPADETPTEQSASAPKRVKPVAIDDDTLLCTFDVSKPEYTREVKAHKCKLDFSGYKTREDWMKLASIGVVIKVQALMRKHCVVDGHAASDYDTVDVYEVMNRERASGPRMATPTTTLSNFGRLLKEGKFTPEQIAELRAQLMEAGEVA